MTKMLFLNKIKPMRFFVSLMLLSIVVQDTDSCSSKIGWKSSQQPTFIATEKTPSLTTTTPPSIVKTDRPKMPSHQETHLPCSKRMDEEYCWNGGKCFMLLFEPYCHCPEGFQGRQCMEKSLDAHYNVIIPKTSPSSSITTSTTTMSLETSTQLSDLSNVPVSKCPEQYDLEYCLNDGTCVMFHQGFSYMCLCKHPFVGLRCEEKSVDGDYNLRVNRRRRRVPKKKNRSKTTLLPPS